MAEGRRHTEESPVRRGVTRRAVLGSAAVGGAALVGMPVARAASQKPVSAAHGIRPAAERDAVRDRRRPASINPDGAQAVPAVLANGRLPGPEIRVREGDQLRILVENRLTDSPTSIHWHGLLVPAAMDGVPDISNAPIAPGQMYVYEYPIRQSGTYWYHSHYGFQEQQGCSGAFVIEPAHEPLRTEHDAVILLGDWLHRSPERGLRRAARPGNACRSGGTKMDGGRAATATARWPARSDGDAMGARRSLRRQVRRLPAQRPRRRTTRGRWPCAPASACACASSTAAPRRTSACDSTGISCRSRTPTAWPCSR